MRFEQPIDAVVTRFPELRMHTRVRPSIHISDEDIRAAIARGRRLHARQVRESFNAAFVRPLAAIVRATAALASYVARECRKASNRRATIRELSALEDHLLRDIGVERRDIADVARALAEGTQVRAEPASSESPIVEQRFEPMIDPRQAA